MAKLKAKIVLKPDPTVSNPPEQVFKDLPIQISLNGAKAGETKDGVYDFGQVAADTIHKVTASFADPNQNLFDFPDPTEKEPKPSEREIKLKNEDDQTVVFQVEPLYKTVRFVGHCLPTIAKFTWKGPIWKGDPWTGLSIKSSTPTKPIGDPAEKLEADPSAVPGDDGGEFFEDLSNTDVEYRYEKTKRQPALNGEWVAEYVGLSAEDADIAARVAFIKSTIDTAATKVPAKDDELKIFVLPECYFLGRYGAYQVKNIPELMTRLQGLVQDPKWRHWVFVFGTVNNHFAPGATELGTVPEFSNLSPVIRGGCAASADHTRLIQKAFYCAELLESGVLESLAPYGGMEITSDKVGAAFQATEAESRLGLFVADLLADAEPQIDKQAIATRFTDWPAVKGKAKGDLKAKGMTWLVRSIRVPQSGEVPRERPDYAERFKEILTAYLKEDRADFYLGGPNVEHEKPVDYDKNYPTTPWTFRVKLRGSDHLLAPFVERLLADTEPQINDKSIADTVREKSLSTESWATLKGLAKGRVKERGSIEVARDIRAATSASDQWIQVFKKLVALYVADPKAEDPRPSLLSPRTGKSFRFEDYSFQCKRKPGPWLKEGDSSVAAKKKIVFGLETCADHSKARLLNATVGSGTKPEIDIQLIPSAGMGISPMAAAARKGGGLVFNCDGWNASSAFRAALVKRQAGLRYYFWDDRPVKSGTNPLIPHTELAVVNDKLPLSFITKREVWPLTDTVATIFANGPGELHVYPPLKLIG